VFQKIPLVNSNARHAGVRQIGWISVATMFLSGRLVSEEVLRSFVYFFHRGQAISLMVKSIVTDMKAEV
jgi:hypothetical protein